MHLECEIEALPRPEIFWYLGESRLEEGEKYCFYRAIQPSNPNIHFVRLTINVSNICIISLLGLMSALHWNISHKDSILNVRNP